MCCPPPPYSQFDEKIISFLGFNSKTPFDQVNNTNYIQNNIKLGDWINGKAMMSSSSTTRIRYREGRMTSFSFSEPFSIDFWVSTDNYEDEVDNFKMGIPGLFMLHSSYNGSVPSTFINRFGVDRDNGSNPTVQNDFQTLLFSHWDIAITGEHHIAFQFLSDLTTKSFLDGKLTENYSMMAPVIPEGNWVMEIESERTVIDSFRIMSGENFMSAFDVADISYGELKP